MNNGKSYAVPRDENAPVKHHSTQAESFSRFNKKSKSSASPKPMDDDVLQRDFDKLMSKRRFYRFKATPVKVPVKAAKDVKHKSNPSEDDKD